jgi:indole-3-glycerol phosphate synthase
MERANRLNAQLIGVNNRDLHSFNVDLNTTSSVMSLASEDIVIAALSGITCKADVEKYVSEGVKAVLVGEALMRAKDTSAFVKELIG